MRVILEESIPYLICLLCSFSGAGYFLVSKVSLNKGMSRYVLVTYGFAIGTLSTALLAYLFERKNNSKLTIPVLRNVLFLGLLGAVLGRTMFYLGLEYTSQTFASAVSNIFPVFTFILAIIFRMEKLDISKNSTRAKIGGTIVSFAGATILTLYKGIKVISVHTQSSHNQSASTTTQLSFEKAHWIKGSLILVSSYFSIAAFYLLQAATVKIYAAPLNLTTLSCLSGTLFSVIMTAILDHKAASWRLSWDITLLAPLYSGIIIFSLGIYLQTIVMRRKGPVFAIAFSPLSSIFAAIMGILILGDVLYLGSIIGATLIIIGLYSILWGKKKEEDIILERTMATDHLNKIKEESAKSNIDIPNNGINWS
ncbi:WAT1-related protein At5g07050-like isoform X1 [Humulus lupulus]|uniref:WAT1-related protein At5g07050-like isoform X1 n=1 Tax=Humulus lupulus TaxID=3486 RepID=UPI002B40908A|nr:WAT1-related protein At5g07050-like isoform X1 [Humulus lupulus]